MKYFLREDHLMDIPFKTPKLLDYLLRCSLRPDERPLVLLVLRRMMKHQNIYFKYHLFTLEQLNATLDKASYYGNIHISEVIALANNAQKSDSTLILSSLGRYNGTVYAECFMVQSDKLTTRIRQKTIDDILETI